MKSKIVVLSLVFVLTLSSMISAASIQDVPEDHWAYQSVKEMVDKGLFQLYEDDTFRGKENVSRYRLAEIVAKILEEISTGQVIGSAEDIKELYKLTDEFRNELVELTQQGKIFEDKIKKIEQKNISQDEFMTELKDVQSSQAEMISTQEDNIASQKEEFSNQLQMALEEIEATKEEVKNIESDVSGIIESIMKISQQEEELENLKSSFTEYKSKTETYKANTENKLSELTADIENVKAEMNEANLQITDETIQELEDKISINSTRLSSLQDELSQVRSELEGKEEEVGDLKEKNDEYRNLLYGVGAVAAVLLLFSN